MSLRRFLRAASTTAVLAVQMLIIGALPAADGDRDASFDGNGVASWELASGRNFTDAVLAVDGQARTILAGVSNGPGLDDEAVAVRFRADGSQDTSFGTDGEVLIDFDERRSDVAGIVVQPDGKVLVVGTLRSKDAMEAGAEIYVTRLTVDGDFDTAFGTEGVTFLGTGGRDTAQEITLDSQGRILVAGTRTKSGTHSGTAFRLTSTGQVDTSFGGGDGWAQFLPEENAATFRPVGIAVDGQDRPLLTATIRPITGLTWFMGSVRLTANGILDQTFGTDGFSIYRPSDRTFIASALLPIAGGGYFVAGQTGTSGSATPLIGIAKFTDQGDLDGSFGSGGVVAHEYFPYDFFDAASVGRSTAVKAMVAQVDGKLLLAGTARSDQVQLETENNFKQEGSWIGRFDPTTGAVDTTFGEDGYRLIGSVLIDDDLDLDPIVTSGDTKHLLIVTSLALQGNGRAAFVGGHGYSYPDDQEYGAVGKVTLQSEIAVESIVSVTRGATGIDDGGSDAVSGGEPNVAQTLTYTVTNSGTGELTLSGAALSNAVDCTAAIVGAPPATLAPNAQATFEIEVTPTTSANNGLWQVDFAMATNDADRDPFDFTISGVVNPSSDQELTVSSGGSTIVDGGVSGQGSIGASGKTIDFTIANTGEGTVSLGEVAISGIEGCTVVVTGEPGGSVAAGSQATLSVEVTPLNEDPWQFRIVVPNSTPANPYDWTVSG
ncbi:MAG: hypothetical protein ACOCXA_05710, partial [Planctomycetota bacterium]